MTTSIHVKIGARQIREKIQSVTVPVRTTLSPLTCQSFITDPTARVLMPTMTTDMPMMAMAATIVATPLEVLQEVETNPL